jgi:hypothetical protein
MDDTGKKIMNLMFRPGERVCVSHNKYGYHSVPFENAISDRVTLVSPDSKRDPEIFHTDRITLVSLNPNAKWREDETCTAFRNILVEMDYGPLKQQLDHIKAIGLPYSAAIFSGNKSIHFLISLDQDFPSEDVYRLFSQWILKAIPLADQKTFNPSRSIRLPGSYREPGKKQRLMEYKGPVKLGDLVAWLQKHPEARPVKGPLREKSDDFAFDNLRPWARKRLINGLDRRKGRSNQWFALAFEFCLAGYSEDDTLRILGGFFVPDRDFKEKEWKTTINSAFKHVDKKTE